MASIGNVMGVITWLFLEILSDMHHGTRNANLSTGYKMDGIDLVKEQCKIYKLEYIFREVTGSSS